MNTQKTIQESQTEEGTAENVAGNSPESMPNKSEHCPRCDICGHELSQCGPEDDDGEPSLDCLVCELRSRLTTTKSDLDSAVALYGDAKAELEYVKKDYHLLSRQLDGHDAAECSLNLGLLKSELAEAKARIAVLEEALKDYSSRCQDCGGTGIGIDRNGEQSQCQWCHHAIQALASAKPAEGEKP